MRRSLLSAIATSATVSAALLVGSQQATAAVPACGTVVKTSITLTGDMDCRAHAGPALIVAAHGIAVDLGHYLINGPGGSDSQGLISNAGFDSVTIRNGRLESDYSAISLTSGANDNKIIGVTANSMSHPIRVQNSQRTLIERVSGGGDEAHLVRLENSSHATVRDIASNYYGVWLENTSDSLIWNNSFLGGMDPAIVVRGHRNRIENNRLSAGSDSDRIWIWSGDGNQVIGNSTTGGYRNIVVDAAATNTRVINNYSDRGDLAGILVAPGASGTLLEANRVSASSRGDGIRVESAATTLRNNTSTDNAGWGIWAASGVTNGGGNVAYNNAAGNCYRITCTGAIVGDSTVGSMWTVVTANSKRVSQFTTPAAVSAKKVKVYLDGNGGASGSQSLRGIIYADSSGTPGQRLGTTGAVTVSAGRAAGWVTFTLPTAVSLQAGTKYWIGLHSGTTAKVARYAGTTATGGLRWNADTYSDGATSPFGSTTTANTRMSVYASAT